MMLHHDIHHVPVVDKASGHLNKAIFHPRVRTLLLVAFSCLDDCGDYIGNARCLNAVKYLCLFGIFPRLVRVKMYGFRESLLCRVVSGSASLWLARTLWKALGCTQERLGCISAVPGREPRIWVIHGPNSVMEPRPQYIILIIDNRKNDRPAPQASFSRRSGDHGENQFCSAELRKSFHLQRLFG